jgi:transketolase
MRDAFVKKLASMAEADDKVFLLVGDLGYGVVDDFAKRFPRQFLNVGVAEQNMMGMAAGLAHSGYKVFVYSIANFPTIRCLEQIRNDVCYHNLDVTVVAIGAGFGYGTLGYSHFAIEDLAVLRCLPNLNIYSPGDTYELEVALDQIAIDKRPNYLRLGKNGEKPLLGATIKNPFCARVIKQGSGDFAILSTGNIGIEVTKALLQISEDLNNQITHFSIPSLSYETLKSLTLMDFSKVLTVEEHRLSGGFGSFILEYLEHFQIHTQVRRIGVSNTADFPIGDHDFIKQCLGVDSLQISRAAIEHFT